MMDTNLPIGIFDSGVGGLTVLREIERRLPWEDLLYLGDTARLPYGTKSRETVTRYSLQAAAHLVERKIKLLVVACNTASAAALEDLQARWPDLPVIGVVEPGAKAACAASPNGRIAVIATESAIAGGAYQRAIERINPWARVNGRGCSLFVALAEEGWLDGPVVEAVACRYLAPFLEPGERPDCLVLGCTHFPLLVAPIRKIMGADAKIVDSAECAALDVENTLTGMRALRPGTGGKGQAFFLTTDDPARFARTGSLFLGRNLPEERVELISL